MGDDDMLLPTAIEKLVKPFLEKKSGSPTVGAAWCPCLVADSKSNEFWTTEGGPTRESVASLLSQLFAGNRGPRCSSILLRREDAVSVGGYQKKYGDLSDIGNWGRAALLSEVAVCINEPLVQYTMHQSNTTGRASVEQWQRWAELVHEDMLTMVRERGDANSEKELTAARNNFISGITLTILSSRVGKPGWIWNALTQSLRTPGAIFTPYMFRRLRKDGKKVLRLVRSAREHRTGAGPIEMKR